MYYGARAVLSRDDDRIRVGKLAYGSPGEVDEAYPVVPGSSIYVVDAPV
jgi:hypothetical protein